MQNEELRKSQLNLQTSQNRYFDLYNFAPTGYFTLDQNELITDVNIAGAALLGVGKKNLINIAFIRFVAHDSRNEFYKLLKSVKRTQEHKKCELELIRDKKPIYVILEINTYHNEIGSIKSILITAVDISNRKKAEEELIDSESHLKRAQAIGKIGSWDWDIKNDTLEWSEELYNIFGVDETFELTFDNIASMIHPDDQAVNAENVEKLLKGADKIDYNFRIKLPNKDVKHLHQSIEVQRDEDGNPSMAFGIMQDVTESEEYKKALKISGKKFKDIFENAVEGIYQTTPEGTYLSVNPAFAHIYGFKSPEQMMEKVTDIQKQLYVHEEDRVLIKRLLETKGEVKNFEAEFYHQNGGNIWVLINSRVIRDENGKIKYYEGTVIDITKLKEAEKTLTQSEEKYRSVLEQSYNGVVLSDDEGKIIEWNKSMEIISGMSKDQVFGKYLDEIILQSIPQEVKDLAGSRMKSDISKVFQTKKVPKSLAKLEYTMQRPDGQERHIETVNFPIKTVGKFFLCTITRDISREKISEAETKEHLKKLTILNKVINTANNASNIQNLLKDVLNSTIDLLGFDSGGIYLLNEETGFTELAYYENLPKPFLKKITKLKADEEPYSIIYQDGQPLYDYMEIKPVIGSISGFKSVAALPLFSAGKVIGSLNVASNKKSEISDLEKDILESIGMETGTVIAKMYTEAAIKDSLAEKEVLLKEIHHRVKNNMQIISSLLNLQLQHVHQDEAVNVLRDSQSRVKSMAMVHEKLYQSPNLTKIDFADYVQKLVYDIFYSYGIKEGEIEIDLDIGDIKMGIDSAIPCGLIINELVTNSFKYAFPNGTGTMRVALKSFQDVMELKVSDNGVGLPEDFDPESTETLGLQLVANLVKQLDGELKINRDKGTQFIITFRELKYKQRMN